MRRFLPWLFRIAYALGGLAMLLAVGNLFLEARFAGTTRLALPFGSDTARSFFRGMR